MIVSARPLPIEIDGPTAGPIPPEVGEIIAEMLLDAVDAQSTDKK